MKFLIFKNIRRKYIYNLFKSETTKIFVHFVCHCLLFRIVQELDEEEATIAPPKIPKILDGKFYKIIKIDNNNIKAQCLNCINKTYCGNLSSTGNFIKHISKVHPNIYDEMKEYTKMKDEDSQQKPGSSASNSKCFLTSNKNVSTET